MDVCWNYMELYDISIIVSLGSKPTNITFIPSPWNLSARLKVCAYVASALTGRRSADLHRCIDGIGALLDRLLAPWL